ncbi:MAG: alanine racemase, partial [Proteobacteria bacterium]|nr:alanine racemase [Pseudomonadota bacterium]
MRDIPRAVLYIDLNILDENYKTIRAKVPPEVKILCVVKADAYGHGATDIAHRLALHGADYFGVATVDEAV